MIGRLTMSVTKFWNLNKFI